MSKKFVRAFALVLVVLMCLSLLPLAARADEGHVCVFEPTTIPPTCGTSGYVQMICPVCGNGGEILSWISPTGEHHFESIVNDDYLIEDSDNLCVKPALYWKSCVNFVDENGTVCGAAAEEAHTEALNKLFEELNQRKNNGEQHTDAEWQKITEDAVKEIDAAYTFTVGGEGHNWVSYERQEATCVNDGWEAYRQCADCGAIDGEYPVIPAKGHRWGEFTVTKEPTCTEDGSKERVCEVCGEKETVVIPALGHKWGAFTVTKAATCTVDGEQEHTCTVCGEKETEVIPAGHKWGEWVVTVEPGCYSAGEQEHTCTVCKEKETEVIPAAHKFGEWVVTMEPTCYSTGEERHTCTVCGETESRWIDMAHKYVDGVCVFCGEAAPAVSGEEANTEPEENTENTDETEIPAGGIETAEEPADAPYEGIKNADATKNGEVVDEAYVGNVLTAAVTPANHEYVYQWYRIAGEEIEEIPGACDKSYKLTEEDLGASVYCYVDDEEMSDATTYAVAVLPADQDPNPAAGEEPAAEKAKEKSGEVDAEELFTAELFASGEEYAPFDQPILKDDSGPVTEALVGTTLTAYVTPTDKTYNYQWIRDNNGIYSYITGARSSTYTLTDDDCTHSVYCSVNEDGHPQPARLSTGVHVRKQVPLPITVYDFNGSESTVKVVDKDGVHSETSKEFNYPVPDASPFNVNALTEDTVTITVTPDIHHGTYIRYVAKNTTVVIPAAKEAKTYTLDNLGTSDVSSKITIFFDIPVCKASTVATMELDQQLDSNPAIRANFVSTYVQKDGQETPYPYAYYYVTPHWKTAPTTPLTKSEIKVVGGFTFTMDLPAGVTDENYDEYDVRVYHYLKDSNSWELIKFRKVPNEAEVEIENFSNFSPFAVVARPTHKARFTGGSHGTVTNPAIAADDKGDLVLPMPIFTADPGYTFKGWLVNGTLMQPGETVHNVTNDIEIPADWAKGFTITFDKNEGTDPQGTYGGNVIGDMAQQYVYIDDDGTCYSLDKNGNKIYKLNKSKYSLKNHTQQAQQSWSRSAGNNVGSTTYADEANLSDVFSDPTLMVDTPLYAVWKRTQVTITFNANGGSGKMEPQSAPLGSTITLKANTFTAPDGLESDKSVWRFAGWSDSATGNVKYKDKESIDAPTTDITLFAVWREKVTIHFYPDSDSGTGTGSLYSQIVPNGIESTLAENRYTPPTGKAFAGWNERKDGTGTFYSNRDKVVFTGETYLYAWWGDPITISYKPNSLDAYGTMDDQKVGTNSTFILSKLGFINPAYDFKGWSTNPKATVPEYADEEEIEGGFDRSTTLYAIWEKHSFTGTVTIYGSTSEYDTIAFPGETLHAEVSGETVFDPETFYYKWTLDGTTVLREGLGSEYSTCTVPDGPYGGIIACEVTVTDPKCDRDNTATSNIKLIGIDESDKRIVTTINGQIIEPDYIGGVTEDMTYSVDNNDRGSVKSHLVKVGDDTVFEVTEQGLHKFFKPNSLNPNKMDLVATVRVINWWTIGYTMSTGSGENNSGSGTVTMKVGDKQLTSSTTISKDGVVLLEPYTNVGNYDHVWIVRQGSGLSLTIIVKPASSSYGHTSLNGGSYYSSSKEYTRTDSITQALMYDVVFNKSSTSPRTADESHLGLWSALCFTSLVGASAILTSSRKRRKNED